APGLGLCDVLLRHRRLCARGASRARLVEGHDGHGHGASDAAGLAPLESIDGRRTWPLSPVRLHGLRAPRATHGAPRPGHLPEDASSRGTLAALGLGLPPPLLAPRLLLLAL